MKFFSGRKKSKAASKRQDIGPNDPLTNTDPTSSEPTPPKLFPNGIKVWVPCPDAVIDICFVHGLTGDREATWTADGQPQPWPQALLPSRLKRARILTFGYDAYVVRKGVASSNRLIDHATNLMADLASDREKYNTTSRPLIFVAHSLGGLVCKKALQLSHNTADAHHRDIFESFKGVAFMGTPHKGAWIASWAKIPASAFGFVKSTQTSLLGILQSSNQLLESIQIDFLNLVRRKREEGSGPEISCFFEEYPVIGIGMIVSKDSAILEGYEQGSIATNHRNMVKFATEGDNGFERVLRHLSRWEKQAIQTRDHPKLDAEDRACLKDLHITNPCRDKTRIEQLKGGLLKDLCFWVLRNDSFKQWRDEKESGLLWIRGDPGKGKTMLICGIIDELEKFPQNNKPARDSANISFFFCEAADLRINRATAVLRGLIWMLVDQQRSLISHIRRQYDRTGKSLFEDVNAWEALSNVFLDIMEDPALKPTYLIIDALDECILDLNLLLDLIVQMSSTYPRIKWLVSSRNWPTIERRLDTAPQKVCLWLELNEEPVKEAVHFYIKHKVQQLTDEKEYNADKSDAVLHHLSSNAEGTFLWVALVCKRLANLSQWETEWLSTEFPPTLESFYMQMAKHIGDSQDAAFYKRILGVVSTVYRPITLDELRPLAGLSDEIPDKYLPNIIRTCGSFLTLRGRDIFFVHHTAKDFLLEKASIDIFHEGRQAEHRKIFRRSLQVCKTLKRDIYELKSPGVSIDDVKYPDPDPLARARYSCLYWVDHFKDSHASDSAHDDVQEGEPVEDFLKHNFLCWIESISLLRGVSEGIAAILKLDNIFQKIGKSQELVRRVHDASRFIRYHKLAIESNPLQVYFSLLIFSPTHSMTKECYYQNVRPDWVLKEPVMESDWSACTSILEGHVDGVTSVAWSPDGSRLASGSNDATVRIWDSATGKCISTLEGYGGKAIAWSPDGSQLASGSEDKTIRIWDLATRRYTLILKGHSYQVTSIAWSPDGSRLASGSWDKTIMVWNLATEGPTVLEDYSDIMSIAWSPDGKRLASGSSNHMVKIWDLGTRKCISSLQGHNSPITSIAWSPDGSQLASGSEDPTIRIWDIRTRRWLSTLDGHSPGITSIAWSPDGSWLASGSWDHTAKIWDVAAGSFTTFEGHSGLVSSVAWSPDGSRLISGSWDKTARIWDVAAGSSKTVEEYSGRVKLITWSPDGSRLALVSWVNTVSIWDLATESSTTLEGDSGYVGSIVWSPDGSRLASGSCWGCTVTIWDLAARSSMTLKGYSGPITSLVWSPDGSRLASGSTEDGTVMIWDLATRSSMVLEGHSDPITSIAWSPDGSRLASGSTEDGTVRVWEQTTRKCVSMLRVNYRGGLKFGETHSGHLHTDTGVFDLASATPIPISLGKSPALSHPAGYGININGNWITLAGENILRLPVEFEAKCMFSLASCATTTVAIACPMGRVSMLTLRNDSVL